MRISKIQNIQTYSYNTDNKKTICNSNILSPQININVYVVQPTIDPDGILALVLSKLKIFFNKILRG